MRIAFIGCVELSYTLLEETLSVPGAEVVAIVTRDRSDFNADFRSLRPLAESAGIPCFSWSAGSDEALVTWLSKFRIDVGYCFGWSTLVPDAILSVPRLGMLGFHPAKLPLNRGRHPLIWALALGLAETASTFFFMTGVPDAGPIVSQVEIPISEDDDAGTLYSRVTMTARNQVHDFTRDISAAHVNSRPQDHSIANVWRKRTRADGRIDWRMGAKSIRNLVRALVPPYPGATFLRNGVDVVVRKVALVGNAPENLEPGKVLSVDGNSFTVRVGDGALCVLDHDLRGIPPVGSYL